MLSAFAFFYPDRLAALIAFNEVMKVLLINGSPHKLHELACFYSDIHI